MLLNNLKSLKSLPILTESVTIDVTPLSQYGFEYDLAKITANIKLAQPLAEDAKFVMPNTEGVKTPKVYLPDGTSIVQSIEPTILEDLNQIPSLINEAVQRYMSDPNLSSMNEIVELLDAYRELKLSQNIITIPAGQSYITFTYSKYVARDSSTGINTLETIVPISAFNIQSQAPGAKANIIILMPFELGEDLNKIIEANWIPPTGVKQDLQKEIQAGRILLSQYWQYDPAIKVSYRY